MIHLILTLCDPAKERPEKYRDFIVFWADGGRRKFEYWEKVNWEIVRAWQYARDLEVGLEKMRDPNDVFMGWCLDCENNECYCGRTLVIVPKEGEC